MLMPPELEPVMPASTFIATASEISGLPGETFSTASRISAKPAMLAMTAPYPTSEAVLKMGSMDPSVPLLMLCFKLDQCDQRVTISTSEDTSSATMMAHMPLCLPASTFGKRSPMKLKSMPLNTPKVSRALMPITSTSGNTASGSGMERASSFRSTPSTAACSSRRGSSSP